MNKKDKEKQLQDVIDYVEKELKNKSIKEETIISKSVKDEPWWGQDITAENIKPFCKDALSTMPDIIIDYCKTYKVNPALILAVTLQESGNGTSNAIRTKNNPMGYMDEDTNWKYLKVFPSLQEGFRACISNFSRNYIAKGKKELSQMAKIYSPIGASNDPNGYNKFWPNNVASFFRKITGKDYDSSMSGPGVLNESLDPVVNGINGGTVGDGTGLDAISFDNREPDDLTEVEGVILSFVAPYHLHKVKEYQNEWRENENYNGYNRRFHFGIDNEGIKATGDDRKILKSLTDNNTSTYINRALFKNKAEKHCVSIGAFIDTNIDYVETEKILIRDTARVLHKYGLNTKDLWREFDLNRAPSHLLYLERVDWKSFLQEIDKQLEYLYENYPISRKDKYEENVGKKGKIINLCNLLETPEEEGKVLQELKKDEEYKIKSYSNTWYEIDKPRGWIKVKDMKVEEKGGSNNNNIEEEEIESVGTSAKIKFPKVDLSKMPEVTNIIDNDNFKILLSFSDYTVIDNYAMMHEPYDKNLVEIITATVTDDERIDALTSSFISSNENNMFFSVLDASPGPGDHCKRSSSELNAIWKSEHLRVEPIYPDLIIPPSFATSDQNLLDPNALPPTIFSDLSVIDDIEQEDLLEKLEDGSFKIKMFDYSKVNKEKTTKGKPINYKDPYPYDDKIHELESHYPKVKVDEIESRLYDCNHIGCPIGQPMAKNFHMLNDALITQSKRTEERLVRIENVLSTMTRNIGRMASRININCVYYGGQDTFGKYKTIRCLKDDRGDDGCSMTIDQCLSCTRYEPIIGQIYDILDSTGINGAYVTDDEQMSYGNAIDFNDITQVGTNKPFADLLKDSETEYESLLKTWEESDREKFIEELKTKYKDDELNKKIEELKEHEYLFKMDWNKSYLEMQQPDVKRYPTEGIKAKYKVEQKGEMSKEEFLRSFAEENSLELETAREMLNRSVTIANAEFTAYYPYNNKLEGGLYDALGNLLKPENLTCAAPKEIPFGTKILVNGTGTDRDGKIYTVTDRGGAIKYNPATNTYRIDLLMKDEATCNKFGRRKGTIQINATSSSNGQVSSTNGTHNNNPNYGWSDLPYVDDSEFGDNDVNKDKENYDKLVAGEWVDTREEADSFEINSYTSEEFYFDGFGTDINNGVDSVLTNALGQSSNEIRSKILEMANRIVDDCKNKLACYNTPDPRTLKYDEPRKMTRKDLNETQDVTAYDCSSFVSCCYFNAGLTEFTNTNTDGILSQVRKGGEIWEIVDEESYKKAKPGDVILRGEGKGNNFDPSHTGIYMGDKKMAHASSRKDQSKKFQAEILISDVEQKNKVAYFCRSKELIKIDTTQSEGTGQFAWPVPSSGRVTDIVGSPRSGGRKHTGIDIGASKPGVENKDVIIASDSGTVTSSGWADGLGYHIIIDHGNSYISKYAHLYKGSLKVNKGDKVNQGQAIAMMGNTGNSFGAHLHFEIRKDNKVVNPLDVVTKHPNISVKK